MLFTRVPGFVRALYSDLVRYVLSIHGSCADLYDMHDLCIYPDPLIYIGQAYHDLFDVCIFYQVQVDRLLCSAAAITLVLEVLDTWVEQRRWLRLWMAG